MARMALRVSKATREWLDRQDPQEIREAVANLVRQARQERPVLLGRLGIRDHLVRKENPGLKVPRGPKGMRVRQPKPARPATKVRS